MSNKKILLLFISVIMAIIGAATAIIGILGLIGGAILGSLIGSAAIGAAAVAIVLFSCTGGVLQLIAGWMGITQRNLRGCQTLGLMLVVIAVISFMLGGFLFSWSSVIALLLPILYLVGIYVG